MTENCFASYRVQCVTAFKKLTYKKLQADFFLKTVPKYKKLISLKYKCTVSYKFKMGQKSSTDIHTVCLHSLIISDSKVQMYGFYYFL